MYTIGPMRWNLDTLYNGALTRWESGSSSLTNFYMTGYLTGLSCLYFHVFPTCCRGKYCYLTGGFSFDLSNDAPDFN